jgi:hypothetical protein
MHRSFIILALILTACSAGRLRYVPQDTSDREVNSSTYRESNLILEDQEKSVSISNDQVVDPGEEQEFFLENTPLDRSIDKLREFEQEHLDQDQISRKIIKVNDLRKNSKHTSSDDGVRAAGVGFMVVAGILLALAIIMYIGYLASPKDVSSAGGCLSTAIGLTGLIIVAVIFGALALLFLIIGLAMFTSGSVSSKTTD